MIQPFCLAVIERADGFPTRPKLGHNCLAPTLSYRKARLPPIDPTNPAVKGTRWPPLNRKERCFLIEHLWLCNVKMPLNLINDFLIPLKNDPMTYSFVNLDEWILVQVQYDFMVYLLVKLPSVQVQYYSIMFFLISEIR